MATSASAAAATRYLSGDAVMTGNADFGGGADVLALAGPPVHRQPAEQQRGRRHGRGRRSSTPPIRQRRAASLDHRTGAIIGVTIDPRRRHQHAVQRRGAANLGANNLIAVNLLTVGDVTGTYKIIQAGSLTGGSRPHQFDRIAAVPVRQQPRDLRSQRSLADHPPEDATMSWGSTGRRRYPRRGLGAADLGRRHRPVC